MEQDAAFYGGYLAWKITSFRPNVPNGTCIETSEYPIPQDPHCSFKLQLCENGSSAAFKNNISLYFNLRTDRLCDKQSRWSSVTFTIKDAIGNVLASKIGWRPGAFRKHEGSGSISRGWGKLLSHAEAPPKGSQLLIEVSFFISKLDPMMLLAIPPLNQRLLSAFNRSLHTDFKLMVDGQSINVCKVIIASSSPVFERLLDSADCKEIKQGYMEIPDFDYSTIFALVEFCYGSAIPEDAMDSPPKLFELLKAADKYLIDDLKKICINRMIYYVPRLQIEIVYELLIMAEVVENGDRLVEACMARFAMQANCEF